ncbi:MAG: hypothetical protein ABR990_09030 [Terracidiphilus sp.]|jgi:hypothetical protein
MKRALTFVFALGFTCCLYAQAVDTTVCDILNNPQSFNGKIVRIKGTAVASFDQFVVKGADCGININKNIWLSYPEGTKGKAGPAAMVQVQPAHNFTGNVPAVQRTPVTLDKNNKDFKLFDSQLAAQYHKGGMCLGCNKFEVTATLVGRLDAVEKAGVQRDKAGKIIGFGGFGHMNAYAARLVLQSVSDITSKEIDYSATLAITKDDTAPEKLAADPLISVRTLADAYAAGDKTGEMFKRAAYAFGKPNEKNTGVVIVHSAGNEAAAKYEGKAAVDSPDGLLFICTINESKLFGDAESRTIMFAGEDVADLRNPLPDDLNVPFFDQEEHALVLIALDAFASGQKTLTLPGSYLIWNKAWPTDGISKKVDDTIEDFILKEELLHE